MSASLLTCRMVCLNAKSSTDCSSSLVQAGSRICTIYLRTVIWNIQLNFIFFNQGTTRNRQLHIPVICDVETGQSSGSSDEAGYRSQPRQLNVKEF